MISNILKDTVYRKVVEHATSCPNESCDICNFLLSIHITNSHFETAYSAIHYDPDPETRALLWDINNQELQKRLTAQA